MVDVAEVQEDALAVLAHPDPDPDLLPALPENTQFALQADTAARLCRAIVKAELRSEELRAAMERDMQAWQELIAKAESRTETWRAIILAWMQRTDTTQLKTPWLTAFLQKGRRRLTWQEEDKVIFILDFLGAKEAVKTTRSVIKKEFTTIYDSAPKQFEGLVTDEIGPPTLAIRVAKE